MAMTVESPANVRKELMEQLRATARDAYAASENLSKLTEEADEKLLRALRKLLRAPKS